jgi:hypothetical protein
VVDQILISFSLRAIKLDLDSRLDSAHQFPSASMTGVFDDGWIYLQASFREPARQTYPGLEQSDGYGLFDVNLTL